MKDYGSILPTSLKVGDLMELKTPMYQIAIGTKLFLYHKEKGMLCFITQQFQLLSIPDGSKWSYLRFLQHTGCEYEYSELKFDFDVRTAFFEIAFQNFKKLELYN